MSESPVLSESATKSAVKQKPPDPGEEDSNPRTQRAYCGQSSSRENPLIHTGRTDSPTVYDNRSDTNRSSDERPSTPKNPQEEKRMNLQSKIARIQHQALIKAVGVTTSDSDSDHNNLSLASRRRTDSHSETCSWDVCEKVSETRSEFFTHRTAHLRDRSTDRESNHSTALMTDASQDSESSAAEVDRSGGKSGTRRPRRKGKPRKKHRYESLPRAELLTELASETAESDSGSHGSDFISGPGLNEPNEEELTHEETVTSPVNSGIETTARTVANLDSQGDNSYGEEYALSGNKDELLRNIELEETPNADKNPNESREGIESKNEPEGGNECENCGKLIPSIQQLKEHTNRRHTVLLCKFCTKCFVGAVALHVHVLETHERLSKPSNLEKSHTCATCSVCFASVSLLQSHAPVHLEETPNKVAIGEHSVHDLRTDGTRREKDNSVRIPVEDDRNDDKQGSENPSEFSAEGETEYDNLNVRVTVTKFQIPVTENSVDDDQVKTETPCVVEQVSPLGTNSFEPDIMTPLVENHKSQECKKTTCQHCEDHFTDIDKKAYNQHLLKLHPGSSLTSENLRNCPNEDEGTALNLRIGFDGSAPASPDVFKSLQCERCSESFSSTKALKVHSEIHEETYKCDSCPESFNRESSLRDHVTAREGTKMSTSQVCSKKFTRITSLKEHVAEQHTELPHSVKGRGQSRTDFSEVSAMACENSEAEVCACMLDSDLAVVETDGTAVSVKTEVESIERQEMETSKLVLKQEGVVSTTNHRHVCPYCGKAFTRNNSLQLHLQIHTGKKFHCDLCRFKFTNGYELARHRRTVHEVERPHACEQCEERFVTLATLKSHMNQFHVLQTCDDCDQQLPGTETLRKHKRTHTPFDPSKPHQCEICLKYFRTTLALIVHSKIHDPECVHECELCPKTFNRKQSLDEYVRAHTGDKRWSCQVCGKKMGRRSSLRDHIARQHPELPPLSVPSETSEAPVRGRRQSRGKLLPDLEPSADQDTAELSELSSNEEDCGDTLLTGIEETTNETNEVVDDENIDIDIENVTDTGEPFTSLNVGVKSEPTMTVKSLASETTAVVTLRESRTTSRDPPPFPCNLCHFRFASVPELVMHKRMNHQGERPYSCEECSETYVDVLSLRKHLDSVHTIQICDICSEQVNGSHALEIHRNSHLQDIAMDVEKMDDDAMKPLKCHLCKESFPEQKALEKHVTIHETDNSWNCELCNKKNIDQSISLTSHIRECHSSYRRRSLRKKQRSKEKRIVAALEQGPENDAISVDGSFSVLSNDPEKVEIGKSGKENQRITKENAVLAVEIAEPPPKKCRRAVTHAVKVETEFVKVHLCKYCGKSFNRNGSLERHIQIHTGKNFACDDCPLKFAAKYDLTLHKRTIHLGERPHSCKRCLKTFISLQNLRSHVSQVHLEYRCDVCSEVSVGKNALKVHKNIHLPFDPSKPFRCDVCFKYFRSQWELGLHTRIHDPEYSFNCPLCPKTFNRKQSLDEHVRLHEEGKSFCCEMCGKRFTRRTSLRDHVARQHPELPPLMSRRSSVKDDHDREAPDLVSEGASELEDAGDDVTETAPDTVSLEGVPLVSSNSATDEKSEGSELRCSICDETFTRKDALNAHELMHVHQGPFKCTECGKDFKRREQFRKHLLKHKRSGECQAECLQCGSEFSDAGALKRHLLTHRGVKPHQCELCGKGFTMPYELRKHKRSVHFGLKDYNCSVCKRRFTSSQGLRSHEKFAHGKGPPIKRFQCCLCSKDFTTKARMESHLRIHTGEKPFQCTICDQRFRVKINLDRHAFIHDPSKRFNCEQCDKFFCRNGHLLVHLAKIHQVKIYRCPYCPFDRYFRTLEELSPHKKDFHPIEFADEEPGSHMTWVKKAKTYTFECDMCPKKFSSKTNLVHHRRIHSGDRPFACEICGHRSVSKSSLKTHYETHTGQKPYPCDYCGRAFGREWVLKRHVLTRHTNFERPHKCDQCEKAFRLPMELKQHVAKLHSGIRERPHECRICRKRFFESQQLSEHFSTHESDGEFNCEYCSVPFPKRSLRETHAKTHRTSRPYECFLCKTTFNDKGGLVSHLSQHEQTGLCQCPFCGKVFRQIANLLSHMITHSGLRSDKLKFFECEPCELTFWRYDSFQDHQKNHHEFVPSETPEEINFISDSLIKEVHDPPLHPKPPVFGTGANELMCGFCGKEFSRKYTLDRHIKCHTNDRPYKCEVCGVRFIAKYDLTLHLRRHNKEKPFACTICGKAYEVAYRLAGHMKNSKDSEHQNAYMAFKSSA